MSEYCSRYCENNDIPTIGTAMKRTENKKFKGFILVEVEGITSPKLKFEENYIGDIANLVLEHSRNNEEYRLQAILKDDTYSQDFIKVIFYQLDQNNYGSLNKMEYNIAQDDIKIFISKFLKGSEDTMGYMPISKSYRDILVCTHALRDMCCGRFGYPVYKFLRKKAENSKNIRVWRSSHLTGHRMAPTLLDLPESRYWGYLNQNIVRKIISRIELTAKDIENHYRGLAGLTPQEQVVEKEVFKKQIWSLLNTKYQISSKTVEDNMLVTVSWDGAQLQKLVGPPKMLKIGNTHCSWVKPAKSYSIIEN